MGGRKLLWIIEGACGDVNRPRFGVFIRERATTGAAKGTNDGWRRSEFDGTTVGELEMLGRKCNPSNHRRPGRPAARLAMAHHGIRWCPGGLIPHRPAEATAFDCCHVVIASNV